jgi:hypothetical protein
MELITNKLDDLRLIVARYDDVIIPVYVDKHSENVFINLNDVPILLNQQPDNSDLQSWLNLKKAITDTLNYQKID